jgi:predicted permease
LLSREDRFAVLNDLDELFDRRRVRDGDEAAAAWYRRQAMQYPIRLLADRLGAGKLTRPSATSGVLRSGGFGETIRHVLRDVRHSARSLIKTPGLSLTILLTVGLGIGGTAAVFSVVHAVLLKPLPYSEPGRVVRIYTDSPPNRWPLSVVDYQAIDEQQTTFESVAAYRNSAATFNQDEVAERIFVMFVTPAYFPLLGIMPLHGRTFVPADAVLGAESTAVLAHRFWRERLGGDPEAIGRLIRLDGNDYTVVGVLPPNAGPLEARREVFPILQMQPPPRKGPFSLRVLGRLRPDAEVGVAEEELRAINERIFPIWKSSYPDSTVTYGVESLHAFVIGDVGARLLVLLGAVGFVLLIASTNAANLLVARGTQRGRELAVRAALGASRGRLLQHLLTESALLAAGGAALGLVLTFAAVDVMAASGSTFVPRAAEIGFSGPVLWFTIAVTLASGLLFGLIPSLQATRSDFERTLGSSGRTATGSLRAQRVRRMLCVACSWRPSSRWRCRS